jgi:signal transduction histidine kinase
MHDEHLPPSAFVSDCSTFFARVVAGATHELTNVLNIVGELAGLQEDMLREAAGGEAVDPGRLAELAHKVRDQTARGQTMLRHLNRFAHTADHPVTAYDVGDVLESLIALAHRFARLERARLELRPPLESIEISGSPFGLALTVFECLRNALDAADETRTIRVVVDAAPGGAEVVVESADPIPPMTSEARARLERAVSECPGRLEHTPSSDDAHRFVIRLHDAAPPTSDPMEDTHAS